MCWKGINDGAGATVQFTHLQVLRLESISRKGILDFLGDGAAKEDSLTAQTSLNAVTWHFCIPAAYPRPLVRVRKFATDVAEISPLNDETMKMKFQSFSAERKGVSVEKKNKLKKSKWVDDFSVKWISISSSDI